MAISHCYKPSVVYIFSFYYYNIPKPGKHSNQETALPTHIFQGHRLKLQKQPPSTFRDSGPRKTFLTLLFSVPFEREAWLMVSCLSFYYMILITFLYFEN
jgi:hypothetical protein